MTLRPVAAFGSSEPVPPAVLPVDRPFLIGRSAEADWHIPDPCVSRRHATIGRQGGSWFITDLSSRHGTSINDRRLEPGDPTPIQPGDVIAFGTWRCRCSSAEANPHNTTRFTPTGHGGGSVTAIPRHQLGGVAQRGLDVLMALTAALDGAKSRQQVAQAVVDAVREATGCRRVVLIEPEDGQDLAVLASTTEGTPRVSRSLIEQAARQGLVQLNAADDRVHHGQSIMDLGIRSAICAPVLVDGSPVAFMMLDTRDAEGDVPADAAAFCESVARLAGLSFQRVSAALMAERHRQLESDLEAARRAQEMLSPPTRGTRGGVAYRFESIPGRVVAGDLFDIFQLDPSRTAFFLGDVSGKGVGAAMLMAACQSQLRTQLLSGAHLADAVAAVNADLHQRTEASKFITLVAGIIDAASRQASLVDAGHGLCVITAPERSPERLVANSGIPLGIMEHADFGVLAVDLPPGAALLLFSDGAIEQPDGNGEHHGLAGVLGSLACVIDPGDAVSAVTESVRRHAAGPLADDLTVASLWITDGD